MFTIARLHSSGPGGAALLSAASAAAQSGRAPAVVTARRFKAWIGRGDGTNRTKLEEVTLEGMLDAYQQAAYRTTITALMLGS